MKSEMKSDMNSDIKKFINRPLKIGNCVIPGRLILAPMAGLTHVAYRELLESYGGCSLMVTEMCSARSVPQENRYVSPVFRWRDEELQHLVCQIFGSDPEDMVAAAKRVEAEGFFGVDLNFGFHGGAYRRFISAHWQIHQGRYQSESPFPFLQISVSVLLTY